ncbi:hypothetical protein CLIB1444_01S10836 [[Candida] jaroonii]|uniref:Uncharacterized protein n=1 Tax=[Candida] jaroonii TaxID=467808 RepID=A0ACA9Y1G2_9ASCO|nr:hypothetical protein CLIB1444_01S10836 [[Candida] jaroonii]
MDSIFVQKEIQSVNDNIISIEVSADMLMQTLKHFEKANSDQLNIRLQKKDVTGAESANKENGRNATLALYYSHMSAGSSNINHTFKIPVKILKHNHNSVYLKEPELDSVDLYMNLPNAFVSTYKRLDKYKKNANDHVTIKVSRRRGGFLGFVLEEQGKFKITLSWNEALDIRKPSHEIQTDSLIQTAFTRAPDQDDVDDNDESEDKEITVKLKDWKMASRIVASCKTVIFLLAHNEACVLHCLLEESDDVEVIYYINGVKIRDQYDE